MKYFKTLEIENNYWIYDRYSNHILQVEEIIYDIFEKSKIHQFDTQQVIECLKGKYQKDEIEIKIQEILDCQKKELFIPFELEGCIQPLNLEELKEKYDNEINHIIFNLTDDCNFRCTYCKFGEHYENSRNINSNKMSYEVIDDSISLIKKHYKNKNDLIIGFYGGEPLLEFKKIQYIVEKINSMYSKVRYSITTNGLLLNEKIINFFIDNNFSLKISLDGPKEIHDKYRKDSAGKGTYDAIKKRIEMIKSVDENYFKSKLGFTITYTPPFELDKIITYLCDNSSESQVTLFSPVDPFDTDFFDDFDIKNERKKLGKQALELNKYYVEQKIKDNYNIKVKVLEDFFGSTLLEFDNRSVVPLKEKKVFPNGTCYPGIDRLFITTDGKLGMCEKVNDQLTFGNVKDGLDFEKINTIFVDYIKVVDEVCTDCWAYRLCGSCFSSAIKNNEISVDRRKEFCQFQIKKIENDLKTYIKIKSKNEHAFK